MVLGGFPETETIVRGVEKAEEPDLVLVHTVVFEIDAGRQSANHVAVGTSQEELDPRAAKERVPVLVKELLSLADQGSDIIRVAAIQPVGIGDEFAELTGRLDFNNFDSSHTLRK